MTVVTLAGNRTGQSDYIGWMWRISKLAVGAPPHAPAPTACAFSPVSFLNSLTSHSFSRLLRSKVPKVTVRPSRIADLEYDPRDHPALIAPTLEGHADAVFGNRFHPTGEQTAQTYAMACYR